MPTDIISPEFAKTIYDKIEKIINEAPDRGLSEKELRLFLSDIGRLYDYLREFNGKRLPRSHKRFQILDQKIEKIKNRAESVIIPDKTLGIICDKIEKLLDKFHATTETQTKLICISKIYRWLNMVKRLNGSLPLSHARFKTAYKRVESAEMELTTKEDVHGSKSG